MTLHVTPEYITSLKPNEIFVFGSNLAGMHGGGAAHIAHKLFGRPATVPTNWLRH